MDEAQKTATTQTLTHNYTGTFYIMISICNSHTYTHTCKEYGQKERKMKKYYKCKDKQILMIHTTYSKKSKTDILCVLL